ncbi:pre-peptidase C-terminal domain-containing protein [Zavarzinella formosa]|uniref:pre-peptidase C-terminal domain-containing protein n=1 Tax=Zavarzinella formosa TaxID=360055 RepID=UPI0002DEEEAD|nr:pre-peptidase C-terminal domain-containing protein [Zavarzinella formosa]
MRTSLKTLAAIALLLLAQAGRADTFFPMLMSIKPVAVQTGTTAECEISARYNLGGGYKVFITGDGVTGEIDPPKIDPKQPPAKAVGASKLKVRFKVTPEALPGVREVRIATPHGVSTVGQLVIVSDPVIREALSNDTMKTAQPVELPATLCGAFEKLEDVDFYKFKVKAGTALTFHVRSQRLQDKIHDLQEHSDPILTLRNEAGTVLAVNDNYFFADPLLHHKFASDGEYYLDIRDVRFGGNADWQYSIEINDRPFVTNVHPMRVTPGVPTRVELVGLNLPADPMATVSLPKETPEGLQWITVPLGKGQQSNAIPVVVSHLPAIAEAAGDNNTFAKAQSIGVPSGVAGRIETEGDVDCYSFEAKAGEKFTFQVIARDHQSAIDPYMRILNDKGQLLAENDDFRDRFVHADSCLEAWAAPANGRYVIEIKDAHSRGGPAFVYFLKVTKAEPSFLLELDTDKTLLAPGTASVIFVRVTRKNGFEGEVQLAIDGLPAGVTAQCGKILAGGRDGCIHVKAAPDAKIGASNVRITGTSSVAEKDKPAVNLSAVARPLQEIYMPGGGRYHYPVDTHTLSVSDPLDLLSVKLSESKITLKPGESKKIEIIIQRAPGFKSNVSLDVVYQHLGAIYGDSLPAGVTVDDKASLTLLTGEQSKGHITLKAAPDAKPVENQQINVMAFVSINFVMKFTYCGDPVLVTVTKP